MTGKSRRPVAIVGARGYSGLELARLLLRHPHAELAGCFATDSSFKLSQLLIDAGAEEVPTWSMDDFDLSVKSVQTVFLATPAEVSLELAPRALKAGAHVVDLSGAFRLKRGTLEERASTYKRWYGFDHSAPEQLLAAENGLVPWAGRLSAKKPTLVANPGCYATSVLMAILPLLRANAIVKDTLVVDAKSGTTGAGRKASEATSFTEVEGECLPYKVARHQHWPEIVQQAAAHSGADIAPFFTTHLLNVRRGIISSIYARLAPSFIAGTDAETDLKIEALFQEAYSNYPLARFGALGKPETDALLSLKRVVGTARTHVTWKAEGDKLHLFSLIDNLVKGAASQAVENFNRLNDEPATTGLVGVEGVL
ncbi:MAG: N-acetyl-gamma-glutamyl-phosphate reductase [Bdellovibrionota bacterium]